MDEIQRLSKEGLNRELVEEAARRREESVEMGKPRRENFLEDFLDEVAPAFGPGADLRLRLRLVLLASKLRETGIQEFTLRKAVALLATLKKALRDESMREAENAGDRQKRP